MTVPARPGTAPIPPNHVRFFHYTGADPEQIYTQGLLMEHAKGESYGEPNQVWASAKWPETASFNRPVVEFSVPYDDPRMDLGGFQEGVNYDYPNEKTEDQSEAYKRYLHSHGAHVTFRGDIRPEEILAVHEPWHSHFNYFVENDLDPTDYQWLKDNDNLPNERRALEEYENIRVHTHWWRESKTAADVRELAENAYKQLWNREDMAKLWSEMSRVEHVLEKYALDVGSGEGELLVEKILQWREQTTRGDRGGFEWDFEWEGLTENEYDILRQNYGYQRETADQAAEAAVEIGDEAWDAFRRGALFERMLDELRNRYPESYKLWPWMIKRVKNRLKEPYHLDYLHYGNWQHTVDVVGGAGQLLNELRQKNQLPQGFDVNQYDFESLEEWIKEWKAENIGEGWEQRNVEFKLTNGWTIEDVKTKADLDREGQLMGHCVGDYCNFVQAGNAKIFSLRDPKGMPHATMEYRPRQEQVPTGYGHPNEMNEIQRQEQAKQPTIGFEVQQIQGKGNHEPIPEYQEMIKEFNDSLRARGMDVQWAGGAWRRRPNDAEELGYLREQNTYHIRNLAELSKFVQEYDHSGGVQYFMEPVEEDKDRFDAYGIRELPRVVPVLKRRLSPTEVDGTLTQLIEAVYFDQISQESLAEYARAIFVAYNVYQEQGKQASGFAMWDTRVKIFQTIRAWLDSIEHYTEREEIYRKEDEGDEWKTNLTEGVKRVQALEAYFGAMKPDTAAGLPFGHPGWEESMEPAFVPHAEEEPFPGAYGHWKVAAEDYHSNIVMSIGQMQMAWQEQDYDSIYRLAQELEVEAKHLTDQSYELMQSRDQWFKFLGFVGTWKGLGREVTSELQSKLAALEHERMKIYGDLTNWANHIQKLIVDGNLNGFRKGMLREYVDAKQKQMREKGQWEMLYQHLLEYEGTEHQQWADAAKDPEKAPGMMDALFELGMFQGDENYKRLNASEQKAEWVEQYIGKMPEILTPLEGAEQEFLDKAHWAWEQRTKDIYNEDPEGPLYQSPQEWMKWQPAPREDLTLPESWSKVAMPMTLPQQLRQWEELEGLNGIQHTHETLHQFENGWTVRKAISEDDVRNIGYFMHNCWQDVACQGTEYALFDPNGLPRVAFDMMKMNYEATEPMIFGAKGMRNRSLTENQAKMLTEFARVKGYRVHPDITIAAGEARYAMAERTGVPELDQAIEDFMTWNYAEELRQLPNEWYPEGEILIKEKAMTEFAQPFEASGMCRAVTGKFNRFLSDRGIAAKAKVVKPEEIGYPWSLYYTDHCVTEIEHESGTYIVDWTSAQYERMENNTFPLVQKEQEGQWTPQWMSKTSDWPWQKQEEPSTSEWDVGVSNEIPAGVNVHDPNLCPTCGRPKNPGSDFCPYCYTPYDQKPDPEVQKVWGWHPSQYPNHIPESWVRQNLDEGRINHDRYTIASPQMIEWLRSKLTGEALEQYENQLANPYDLWIKMEPGQMDMYDWHQYLGKMHGYENPWDINRNWRFDSPKKEPPPFIVPKKPTAPPSVFQGKWATLTIDVTDEEIPEEMLRGYQGVGFRGTPMRLAIREEGVNSGHPYFKDNNLAAFLDYFDEGSVGSRQWVNIGFMQTAPEREGQGYARQLLQTLYDRYPNAMIRWGKIMDDKIDHLKEDFQARFPDRTSVVSDYVVYHGTTNVGWEVAQKRGGIYPRDMKELATEVAEYYGLNPDEFYNHEWFEFPRWREQNEPEGGYVYLASDLRTAEQHAQIRNEQLQDALRTAWRMLKGPESFERTDDTKADYQQFEREYHEAKNIQPVVLTIRPKTYELRVPFVPLDEVLDVRYAKTSHINNGYWKFSDAIPAEYKPTDPLDLAGKQPVFHNMQVEWWTLPEEEQRQVIVNAFRATMLSPRLNLKMNAIMYQEMMTIPAEESDPDVFEEHARALKAEWDRQGQGDIFNEVEPRSVDEQVPGKLIPGFWGNVRRLSALGPHAVKLQEIAMTDILEYGGTGKYFREEVLKMGIPGVGPKVASFAWLALNPTKSDLGTIDVWMMRHLQQDTENPNSPAHYFQLENQLRDEKDALYGPEVPLGQYQWGVWDKIRTPGYHQDHSPLRVHEPTPYTDVSWGEYQRGPRPQRLPEQHPEQQMLFSRLNKLTMTAPINNINYRVLVTPGVTDEDALQMIQDGVGMQQLPSGTILFGDSQRRVVAVPPGTALAV